MLQNVSPEVQATMNKVGIHLEFLGYEIKRNNEYANGLFAVHPEKTNISIKVFSRAVRFTAFYNSNYFARENRQAFLEFVNILNMNSIAAQCSIDLEGTLVITSFFLGTYDKVIFGQFIDLWHDDIQKIHNADDVSDFFS